MKENHIRVCSSTTQKFVRGKGATIGRTMFVMTEMLKKLKRETIFASHITFLIQQIYEEVVLISSINISVSRTVLCVAESGF